MQITKNFGTILVVIFLSGALTYGEEPSKATPSRDPFSSLLAPPFLPVSSPEKSLPKKVPVGKPEEPSSIPQKSEKISKPDAELLAIVTQIDGNQQALLEIGKVHYFVKEGESFSKFRLLEIKKGEILLQDDNQQWKLFLPFIPELEKAQHLK